MSKKYAIFLLLAALFFASFPGISVKSSKEEGELERQINKLKNLKQSGKKLGLVIGRTGIDQSSFSSKGKKMIWSYETLPYDEDLIEETSLKLNANFLESKDIKPLETLFSAVVIDRFSWNFLQNESADFMTHYSKLLEKNAESCIFFEAVPTMVFVNNENEDGIHYTPYSYKIPFSWLSCAQSEFGSRTFDLMRPTFEKNMLSTTQNHLMGLFESVTRREFIVRDLLYTHENEPKNQINSKIFFVLKQPIHAPNDL